MAESKAVPNVNFMLNYYLPHYEDEDKQDERNYYSSRKYNDYVKYVSTGIKDLEKIDYVEYANNDTKSSGIYNENGKLSKEQIKILREHLHDTDSIIWSGVISFEKDFGLNWCNNHTQAEALLQRELPKFFKRAGFKPENMEWYAGLHENTDNRHIHLVFFEKEPIRKVKGEKAFSIGMLSKQSLREFKLNLELSATDYKAREIRIRTNLTRSVKEELNGLSTTKLRSMLLNLADVLPKEGHTYYECEQMQRLKPIVDSISNYIISKNENIMFYKEDFDSIVKEKDDLTLQYYKRNHLTTPTQSVGDKMQKDLYRRLGNMVIEKSKQLKLDEVERLKLDARYRAEKQMQKKKYLAQLQECLYLSDKFAYETIKSFQDFIRNLEEVHIKRLKEEGIIQDDGGYEMEL